MKKLTLVLIAAVMGLAGCGFKTVKKEEIYKALKSTGDELSKAQVEICSPEAIAAVQGAKLALDVLAEKFE